MIRVIIYAVLLLVLAGCGQVTDQAKEQTVEQYIYLVEITAYDPGIAGTRVLRYCTGAGYTTGPADTQANTYYEPRVIQPGTIKQDMFSNGTTGGASRTGYGEIVLANQDGALDGLLNYGLDGQQVVVRGGLPGAAYPAGFAVLLTGTMEQPVGGDQLSIRIRDRQAELDVPIQPTKYAGTNALPDGLEGVSDLLGKPKPLLFGARKNISPVLVNTSRLIYQINDGAAGTDNVYDQGVALTKGADYASQSDMETNAPAAGTFRAFPAGGYFRLGSSPAGQVTADATTGDVANQSCAQLCRQIVLRRLTPADLIEQGFIDLDKANNAEVGIYIDGEMTVAAALDELCRSVGAWYGFDNLGKFRIQRLEIPSGNPIATLTNAEGLTVERLATNDAGRGVPAYRVVLDYDQNCTVQTSGLAGSVPVDRRNWLKDPYRSVKSEDLTVLTPHKLAPELHFTSRLATEVAAQAEADRLQLMYSTRRDLLAVSCPVDVLLYPSGGWWDDLAIADMPYGRYSHTSTIHNDYLYQLGGAITGAGADQTSVYRLNLLNPTAAWETSGVTNLPAARTNHASVINNGYVYLIGGSVGASVIRLDLNNPNGAWDDAGVTDLPAGRSSHMAVLYNNYVYVVGGVIAGIISPSVIRVDLNNPAGAWDDAGVTDLPAGRYDFAAVVSQGYLYVIGGNTPSGITASVMRLDLNNPSGAWDDVGVADLPIARYRHEATVLNGKIYVVGGTISGASSSSVVLLDTNNQDAQWVDMPSLPRSVVWTRLETYDNNILLSGGWSSGAAANSFIYRSNDSIMDWSRIWDLGRVIKLKIPRYGFDLGKLFRLIGTELDHALNTIKLTLWG